MPSAPAAGSGGGDERKACAVDASWAIAEELAAAGYATEAALVLDTAVARLAGASTRSAADPAIEVATRIRAADLLLAHTGSTDAPKRLLEGGLALVEGPRLQPHTALRANFYRLLGVALRRRQRFHDALRALNMAAKIAPDSGAADATTVEVVRVHFAVCVETGFNDGAALERLRDATRPAGTAALQAQIPPAEMAATACSLVVCHCLALALLGEYAASVRVLTAASQLHGPGIRAQFGILERCVAASAGIPPASGGKSFAAPADTADAASPQPAPAFLAALPETLVKAGASSSAASATAAPTKQHRREETAVAGDPAAVPEPVWMSRGAATAVMLLQDLVAAAATAGPHATAKAERVFQDLSKAADGTLRHITAAGTAGLMTPAANAELRLMVGVKLAAFLELAILDVTRGNWAAAGSKLDELSAFMLVFARHTAHFAAPFHAVATVLAVIVGDLAAADGHIAALEACGATSGDAAAHAFVMRCFRAHAAGERRVLNDLVQAFALAGGADDQAQRDDDDDAAAVRISSRAREAISRSPRLALLVALLRGANQVQSHDWRGATTTLKAVANDARNAFGVASPVVACSLRLLADAHGQSGNAGSSEAAVAMATQVAAGCGDIVGLAQCVAWTVGRMHDGSSSAAAPDSERRAALSKDLHAHTASYHAAVKEAAEAPAVARVLAFLPESNPDYRRWLSSSAAATAAGGRPSSGNNGRLSGASARGSTEVRR